MDIKILDTHLREHLETNAKPLDIARAMSLTSASIERVNPFGKDWLYEVEVTTNRVDMASVRGIAREAATVLPHFGYKATLLPLHMSHPKNSSKETLPLTVKIDEKLVNRVCGILIEVTQKESPQFVKDRLEATGIRSLNNLVDITNYVMIEIGHPAHVFDYDRLKNHTLIIRESKKGEKIVTLDKKEHMLPGGDIVADNGEGEIVDLLGIMGTDNSVVTSQTTRILFFFDNNDPWRIRKTSMGLAIRTNAAALDEKGVDPELAMQALLRGVELYKDLAGGKVLSDILDMYPHQPKHHKIVIDNARIQQVIGVPVPLKQSVTILESLGFEVHATADTLHVTVPTWREMDVTIPEDIIEEVARIYGYHNIPSALPPYVSATPYHMGKNQFYWENRIKQFFKYLGWTEVYTYSMVSETLFEGPLEKAVTLANPLDSDHVHMRATLTPSLLEVVKENKSYNDIQIFEISNVYIKRAKDLPHETRTLAGVIRNINTTFYTIKGYVEQLSQEMGLTFTFKQLSKGGLGADIFLGKERIGEIEVLEKDMVSFELNFETMTAHATLKKSYTPLAKYPPIIEDISIVVDQMTPTGDIISEIEQQSPLIKAEYVGAYQNTRTFHIMYQDREKNLKTEDIAPIREKINNMLQKEFSATIK